MDDDKASKKDTTRRAVERYLERQLKRESNELKPPRKNQKPEKLVEKACLDLMRGWGWKVRIYESKATWDPRARCYRQQSMSAGNADCMGNMADGRSVAIEFKAKGKLTSYNRDSNYRQREFIHEKIKSNVFACVVDSAEMLTEIYQHWQTRLIGGEQSAQNYLFDMLPKPRRQQAPKTDGVFD